MRVVIYTLLACLVFACNVIPRGPSDAPLSTPHVRIITSAPPTPVPSPTGTPTVREWIAPYTIPGLREHAYQIGEVHVGKLLAETDLYRRYAIKYPSGGLTITGVMQVPKSGEGPFPVIIMNHGFFARSIYLSGDGTDRAAEFLNRHGYLTLASDYRSWGGSDVGPSLFYSGLVIDVINLIEAVPSIPQADPDRIGMWGHSMGGGVTFKVLVIDPKVKAAVLYSTVSADDADIIARWGPGCVGDIATGEQLYGCNSSDILPLDLPPGLIQAYRVAASDSELLKQVAAVNYFEDVSAPVQIHYGSEDGILYSGTPPEWSQNAYEALLSAGKRSEIFVYEGEKHSFIGDQWWALMERSAHFFDKYVK